MRYILNMRYLDSYKKLSQFGGYPGFAVQEIHEIHNVGRSRRHLMTKKLCIAFVFYIFISTLYLFP